MTDIIMKNDKPLKLNRRTYKVDHVLVYECPSCKDNLSRSPQSIFTRVDKGFDIWVCEKCEKLYRLAFQELIFDSE